MEALFSPETRWYWSVALGLALFFPARHLIWVLSVRRAQAKQGGLPDEAVRQMLRARAGATAALVCLVFAAVWGSVLFGGGGR
jgi:hypothetical protein